VETDVLVARRLHGRIVVLFMDREREYRGVVAEDRRGPVPLMHVDVDDRGAPDPLLVLQVANRDRDVIEDAKTFSVVGERVMKTAGKVDSDLPLQRQASGLDAPSRAEERRLDERLRIGELQHHLLEHREVPGNHLVDIGTVVHAEHLVHAGPLWHDDLLVAQKAPPHDLFPGQLELPHRKDMKADLGEVRVRVDDAGAGTHGPTGTSRRKSTTSPAVPYASARVVETAVHVAGRTERRKLHLGRWASARRISDSGSTTAT